MVRDSATEELPMPDVAPSGGGYRAVSVSAGRPGNDSQHDAANPSAHRCSPG